MSQGLVQATRVVTDVVCVIIYDDDQSSPSDLESRPKRARFLGAYKYKSKFSKDWTNTWAFIASVPHDLFSFSVLQDP